MPLASIVHRDHFEVGFIRNADQAADKARQLVDLNGSYRTRTHDMGGMSSNAQISDSGLLRMLGNTKILTMCGKATSYDDARTREEQLKIDIVRAFGSEIAQMGDFIAEVMQSLGQDSQLSEAQQDKLFEMVTEIVTLKNLMNVGALPEGQARLETLIARAANKIADILLEGMDNKIMAKAIVDFVHTMLSDVGQKIDIPSLDEKMIKIEGRMNPEEYLENAASDIIAKLIGILDSQDLSEEAKAEIESLIEKIEKSLEAGEPIPRETLQALESLSDNYPDVVLSENFSSSLETLLDANIVAKADALGISITQMQTIETAINTLDSQRQIMMEGHEHPEESKTEVKALIDKLLAFSDGETILDRNTVKSLESLSEEKFELAVVTEILADITKVEALADSFEEMNKNATSVVETIETQSAHPLHNAQDATETQNEIETSVDKLETLNEKHQPLDTIAATPSTSLDDKGALPILDTGTTLPTQTITTTDAPSSDDTYQQKETPSSPSTSSNTNDVAPATPGDDSPITPPTSPTDEQPPTEGDKPAIADQEQQDKHEQGNDQKGDGHCGPGQCTCDFGEVAKNDDGTVDLELVKGEKITVTAIEADKLIEKQVTEVLEIGDESWKNTLDQFDGDKVKAFEYLADQNKQEAQFEKKYVASSTDMDSNKDTIDAIARKMNDMGRNKEPFDPKKQKLTGPWDHVCPPGCKHGDNSSPVKTDKNKTGQKRADIDTTNLHRPENNENSENNKKVKKKKKPKANTLK